MFQPHSGSFLKLAYFDSILSSQNAAKMHSKYNQNAAKIQPNSAKIQSVLGVLMN